MLIVHFSLIRAFAKEILEIFFVGEKISRRGSFRMNFGQTYVGIYLIANADYNYE